MDSFDELNFNHVVQPEGEYTFCKGCIYSALYEHYHEKVLDMKG